MILIWNSINDNTLSFETHNSTISESCIVLTCFVFCHPESFLKNNNIISLIPIDFKLLIPKCSISVLPPYSRNSTLKYSLSEKTLSKVIKNDYENFNWCICNCVKSTRMFRFYESYEYKNWQFHVHLLIPTGISLGIW